MIAKINKVRTKLAIIHNIPKEFFLEIEGSEVFGEHLFPNWANTVFSNTDLHDKFEVVYNAYKSIPDGNTRVQIITAFISINQIEKLCNNSPENLMIILNDLPVSIRLPLDTLFRYLYKTAINYRGFQTYVSDTLYDTINRFISNNKMSVCPFCGLESYINIKGQARLPLDHWLCQDIFPMSTVNLNNLVPIGKDCNQRPAKGDKNVLINENTGVRILAHYPYYEHSEISTAFNFVNEPDGDNILDEDWTINITPNNPDENDIFQNWASTMNIETRYSSYIRNVVFKLWENDYKEFIEDEDNELTHANSIDELKYNFKRWRASFKVKGRPGAILYRAFINYLIDHGSDAYLAGLYENFRR